MKGLAHFRTLLYFLMALTGLKFTSVALAQGSDEDLFFEDDGFNDESNSIANNSFNGSSNDIYAESNSSNFADESFFNNTAIDNFGNEVSDSGIGGVEREEPDIAGSEALQQQDSVVESSAPRDPFAFGSSLPPSAQLSSVEPTPQNSFMEQELDQGLRSFSEDLKRRLHSQLQRDLSRYCFRYCSVLSFEVSSREVFDAANPDLGFEDPAVTKREFSPERVTADILVDSRYGSQNLERLKKLLNSLLRAYSYPIEMNWTLVELPETDDSAKSLAEVKRQFNLNVRESLQRLVRDYCPDQCQLVDVQVNVEQASIDDINSGSLNRYIFARGARGAVYVKGVEASLSLDSQMPSVRQQRIENLVRDVLEPYGSVSLSIRQRAFPQSAAEIEREREDPYGLEKLRRTLEIFKEFAGTKEIVRETNSELRNSNSREFERETSEATDRQYSSTESSQSSLSRSETEQGLFGLTEEVLYILGAILLLIVLAGALALRFVMSGKSMQQVVGTGLAGGSPDSEMTSLTTSGLGGTQAGKASLQNVPVSVIGAGYPNSSHEELVKRLECQRIRDELIETFLRQPKVAREVFSRILKEDGVQYAAKCVAVFGEIVTFELLEDNDLVDGLSTLAEYVHKNVPKVPLDEELNILQAMKLRVAAGKIRVMSSKATGAFDFLQAKTPRQIYNLIVDENSHSQSIVLTQLPKKKRNAVFDIFEGESKVGLLRALCQGQTIATEHLMSLADALRRKAQRSGIMDQGAMSGVDVLLDLMGQSSLAEQQDLMFELDATNPEAARMVRSSLLTPETLQFVRDGLLIEVFLGLESETLACFLAGCPDHIRNIILAKVPQDLAEDWYDMISVQQGVAPDQYVIAEMQVLGKVRSFAESGLINLLAINQSLFPVQSSAAAAEGGRRRSFKISQSVVA